jgi:hypothetical protein
MYISDDSVNSHTDCQTVNVLSITVIWEYVPVLVEI